jgi:cation:H+ antiporter
MMFLLTLAAFGFSIWLMVEGAEKFTEGVLRTSVRFGIATFVLGYLVSGIDLENLAVGVVAAGNGQPGISMGTVIGSATFLLLFAVGLTAVIHPLHAQVPRRLLVLTLLSPLPMVALGWDGLISRADGVILLVLALALIAYVLQTARTHPLLRVKERKVGKAHRPRPSWWAPALLVGGTLAIAIGAELFSWSISGMLGWLGWSGTRFGMLVVAAAVSAEEMPRMLAPARQGHATISVGNILGTVMFFALFNLGVIAIVSPLAVDVMTLRFYWPVMYGALLLVSVFLWRGSVSRAAGALLLLLYGTYAVVAAIAM